MKIVVDAIPQDMKYAISVGIGLVHRLYRFENGQIIVNSDSTLAALGKFSNPAVWITLFD